MPEIQTFEAPGGVLPYYFLQDHRAYSQGDIAGLKIAVGDQLAETFLTTQKPGEDTKKTAICVRATAQHLADWKNRHAKVKAQTEPLVAVQFSTDVGSYRGPAGERKGDIAGFAAKIARQYVEGYVQGNKKVGSVARYYIAPKDTDVNLDPELEKPRKTAKTKSKRQQAALAKSPRTAVVE